MWAVETGFHSPLDERVNLVAHSRVPEYPGGYTTRRGIYTNSNVSSDR